jgi:hypothetical protein
MYRNKFSSIEITEIYLKIVRLNIMPSNIMRIIYVQKVEFVSGENKLSI